jgi:sorbitol/mannitol transport system permease protein
VTAVNAGTLAVAVPSFSNPEGFFWAKLFGRVARLAGAIMVFGWLIQRQLARGLIFGAVNRGWK